MNDSLTNVIVPLFTILNNNEVIKGIEVSKITIKSSNGPFNIPIIQIARSNDENYMNIIPVELLEDSKQKKEWDKNHLTVIEFGLIKRTLNGFKLFQREPKNKDCSWPMCICLINKDNFENNNMIDRNYNGYTGGEEVIKKDESDYSDSLKKFQPFPGEIIREGTIINRERCIKRTLAFITKKNEIFRIKYTNTPERFYLFDGIKLIGPLSKEEVNLIRA